MGISELRSMATGRALAALLVCLTLCVSSPLQASDEAAVAWADEESLLQVGGDGFSDIEKMRNVVRADKNAAQHIADANAAAEAAVPTEAKANADAKPQDDTAQRTAAIQQDTKDTSAQQFNVGNDHDSTWHCNHCDSSCKTAKCQSWCRKVHCRESPLFTDTSQTQIPAGAGNQWKCGHCKSVCRTQKCHHWCKKMWCPVDLDGNAYDDREGSDRVRGKAGPPIKIHGGKGKMELLEVTKNGSPQLVAMERNTNKLITLSNQDTTGVWLRHAENAIEGVLKQREIEQGQFKERATKANEADQKRYSKKRYQKWKNQKEGADGLAAEEEVNKAKEATQKDNAKEIRFKSEGDQGAAASKDLDKKIEEEDKEFEDAEKQKKSEANKINKDHKDMVSPDTAVFHMKQKP